LGPTQRRDPVSSSFGGQPHHLPARSTTHYGISSLDRSRLKNLTIVICRRHERQMLLRSASESDQVVARGLNQNQVGQIFSVNRFRRCFASNREAEGIFCHLSK